MLPDRDLDDLLDGLVSRIGELTKRVNDLEKLEGGSGWIDYSATSTIVGWSSFTAKWLYYKRIFGKLVFVKFYIQGTSNNVATSFTITDNISNTVHSISPIRCMNNGVWVSAWGFAAILTGANLCNLYSSISGAGWTASGDKRVHGEFWYIAA